MNYEINTNTSKDIFFQIYETNKSFIMFEDANAIMNDLFDVYKCGGSRPRCSRMYESIKEYYNGLTHQLESIYTFHVVQWSDLT